MVKWNFLKILITTRLDRLIHDSCENASIQSTTEPWENHNGWGCFLFIEFPCVRWAERETWEKLRERGKQNIAEHLEASSDDEKKRKKKWERARWTLTFIYSRISTILCHARWYQHFSLLLVAAAELLFRLYLNVRSIPNRSIICRRFTSLVLECEYKKCVSSPRSSLAGSLGSSLEKFTFQLFHLWGF